MLTLTRNGLVRGDVPGVEDEELTSLVEGQTSKLKTTFEEFRRELDRIESDGGLTDEGKAARKADLVEDWRPRLRAALNLEAIERLSRQIETKQRMMHQFSNRLDLEHLDMDEETAKEMVRETRKLLRQKLREEGGQMEVERIAGKAAMEDDIITMRAVEFAPPSFPLLSEEKLAPIRERHAAEHFPEHAAELQEKRATLARLQHNALQAREQIQDLTGEDPVHTPEFMVLQEDHSLEPFNLENLEEEGEPEAEPETEPEPDTEAEPALTT